MKMEESHNTSQYARLLPALVLLVAVIVRLLYFAEIVNTPAFSHPIYDPEYNAHWARGLATGDWTPPPGVNDPEITTTPHGRPPGYPWFLAAVYIVFGVNDYAPRLVQMAMGVINALLLFYLGRRVFGQWAGFLGGLFMATYWVFPYFEGLLTYPVVAVFVGLSLFLVLDDWLHTHALRWALFAGMLLGCFALLRPNVLLFAPVLLVWMGWRLRRAPAPWRRCVFTVAAVVAGCVAVLSPAFIRNYMVARDFVFLSSYGGINMYVGNHPEASLVEPHIPELMELAGIDHWTCFDYPAIVRGVAARQGRDAMRFSEANRYFYHKAFSFIREQPGVFLKNLGRKALLFWGPYEITNDTVMEYDKRFSRTLRYLPGFPWAAALFVFGTIAAVADMKGGRRLMGGASRAMPILLWLFTAFYFLSVIIYFVAGRYRVPVIPVLLLFGAYGVMALLRAWQSGRRGKALGGALVLCLLIAAFHWNPTGYVPRQSTWHLRTAMALAAAGDDAGAEAEYRKALAHGAATSIVYANLGRLHIARGQREEGVALYRQGLALNPHSPVIHNNLGYELFETAEMEEAINHYQQAVTVNPRFALAHINLGNALVERGRFEEALTHFQEAGQLKPGDVTVLYNIARTLFAQGEYEAAAAQYAKALALHPDFAEALNNLGYLHAVQGDSEAAISYYRRAVAAMPDFILAYNNLGNALIEAGDMAGAEDAYRDALAINPEDRFSLYNMGRVLMLREQWGEAQGYLDAAVQAEPGYGDALALLGKIHLEQGDAAAAVARLEQAVALFPGDPGIRALLEKAHASEGEAASLESLSSDEE